MSTHKYPAELTPDQAEGIERAIEGIRSILTQAYISARSHERLLQEVSAALNRVRAERDAAVAEQHRLFSGMVNAGRELDAARRWAGAWKRAAIAGRRALDDEYYAQLPLHKQIGELKNEIERLERQLAETQQALAVAEEQR